MTGRRPPRASTRRTNQRQYPRTARLNQLVREIVADALEQIDDERLDLVTVTSVEVEPDLRHALVFYDSLQGVEGDEEVLEALVEWRPRLQRAVSREARVKRTPELAFTPDPAVRQGALVESLLAEVQPGAVEVPVDPDVYESLVPPDPGARPADAADEPADAADRPADDPERRGGAPPGHAPLGSGIAARPAPRRFGHHRQRRRMDVL